MDKIIDILQFLRKRLYFPDGLVAFLIFSEITYLAATRAIGHQIVLLITSMGFSSAVEFCRVIYIIGFLAVPLFAWILWRRITSVPRFGMDELAVVFAPNASPETQEV